MKCWVKVYVDAIDFGTESVLAITVNPVTAEMWRREAAGEKDRTDENGESFGAWHEVREMTLVP